MRVRPQGLHELGQIKRVILDIELARRDRNIPRIVPVGDIDIGIGQQRGDGGPQKRRVMPRHRRDQQHLPGHRRPAADEELHQIAEGFLRQPAFTSTRWSCPSGPTIDRMPQSGLAIMRLKVRSVTSPQAAISGSNGFIDMANAG
jgi:hypothetical protein